VPVATFEANFDQFQPAVAGATAALDKVEAKSVQTAAALDQLTTASAGTAPQVGTLSSSLRSFDSALQVSGVHMGPEIRAVIELGEAAGKSGTELGLLTTAGLSFAAFMVGVKIGGWVNDWLHLDVAIGNATAKMLGWGDAVGQAAGAKADVLAKATKTAGREITSFTEAMAINAAENQRFQDSLNTSEMRAGRFRTELSNLQTSVHSVTAEQSELILVGHKLHESVSAIAKALGITEASVSAVIDKDREHQASMKASAEDAKKLAFAQADVADKYRATWSRLVDLKATTETIDPLTKASIVTWLKLGAAVGDVAELYGKTAGQIKKVGEEDATATAAMLTHLGQVNAAVKAEFDAQVQLNKAQGLDASGALAGQVTALGTLEVALAKLHAAKQAGISQTAQETVLQHTYVASLEAEAVASEKAYLAVLQTTAAHDKAAASVQALSFQMQAYAGTAAQALAAEEAIAKAFRDAGFVLTGGPSMPPPTGGGHVTGYGSASSSSASVVNHIYVNGTAADVARQVSAEIMKTVKAGTKVGGA